MPIPQQASDLQTKVQKIVMVGMKIMYDPSMRKTLMAGVTSKIPMPKKLALETAGVMKLIDMKTNAGIPPDAVAPSAVLLMYEFALFMKQSGAGEPTQDDMKAAMVMLQKLLIEVFTKTGKAVTQGRPQQQPQPQAQPAQQPAGLIQQQAGA